MAHPAIVSIRDELRQMDEEVLRLSLAVEGGERTEVAKLALRRIIRRTRALKKQVERFIAHKWAGAEEWLLTLADTIITICQIALSEFKRVPGSTEQAFA